MDLKKRMRTVAFWEARQRAALVYNSRHPSYCSGSSWHPLGAVQGTAWEAICCLLRESLRHLRKVYSIFIWQLIKICSSEVTSCEYKTHLCTRTIVNIQVSPYLFFPVTFYSVQICVGRWNCTVIILLKILI